MDGKVVVENHQTTHLPLSLAINSPHQSNLNLKYLFSNNSRSRSRCRLATFYNNKTSKYSIIITKKISIEIYRKGTEKSCKRTQPTLILMFRHFSKHI